MWSRLVIEIKIFFGHHTIWFPMNQLKILYMQNFHDGKGLHNGHSLEKENGNKNT